MMNLFFLILILVLSSEIVVRYSWWAIKTWKLDRNQLLIALLPGIAMLHLGITFIIIYQILGMLLGGTRVYVPILSSLLICGGSVLHLVPCWRISCGYHEVKIVISAIARVVFAYLLFLIALWEQL